VSKAVPLNNFVYNLLIEKNLNDFTIKEIRDALMISSSKFDDKHEAHRFIYRQVIYLVDKKLLIKQVTAGSKLATYAKSALFLATKFVAKSRKSKKQSAEVTVVSNLRTVAKYDFQDELSKEKHTHEADLAVILCEVEEYKDLIQRFPEQVDNLKELYLDARGRSAQLLGKINAITKVLSKASMVYRPC